MKITSPSFEHNEPMPKTYTCDGEDINPSLRISEIPEEAVSLALIMDDPDAVSGTFVHWVVYGIPPQEEIGEDSVPGRQGMNDFGRKDYGGPCPPSGTHRYFFRLYALDEELELEEGLSRDELEEAMEGHVIDRAEVIGLYSR